MITLEPLDKHVALHARSWRNDPTMYKWFRQVGPISDVEQERWFEKQSLDPTVRMFGIGVGDYAVGVCGLTSVDLINRRAEMSMYLNPEESGKGYGKAAFTALFNFGFDSLGLHQIWAECFDGNPVIPLLEKLGCKRDGVRRDFYWKEGKFIDAHLVSILRSEWNERRS